MIAMQSRIVLGGVEVRKLSFQARRSLILPVRSGACAKVGTLVATIILHSFVLTGICGLLQASGTLLW